MSMKNSSDKIGNRTRDLPACSAVPQPTVLQAHKPNMSVQECLYLANAYAASFGIWTHNLAKRRMRQAPDWYKVFTISPLSSVLDGLGSDLLVMFERCLFYVCAHFLCSKMHDIGSLSISICLVNEKVNCPFYWNSIIFSGIGYYFAFKSTLSLLVMLHLYQILYQRNLVWWDLEVPYSIRLWL
jgi:hypothetical protein